MTMQWSAVKEDVFRFAGNLVVSAGAGSGKTAVLVELYLRLLAGETSIGRPLGVEEIVAITFTDKAAVEMRERVRRGIRDRLRRGEGVSEWQKALRELPNAPIATFHSLCASILREHPAEAGVDPAFTLLDELAAHEELEGAVGEVLELELQQRSDSIRLLLGNFPLSGVGRGKGLRDYLRELHHRLAGGGLTEEALLGIAEEWETRATAIFSERSAELAELVGSGEGMLAGPERKEAAFHLRLRQLISLFQESPLIIDDPGAAARIVAMSACLSGNWGKSKPLKDSFESCLDELGLAAGQLASGPLVRAMLKMTGKVTAAYQQRKNRRGAVDFEDLQVKSRDLLKHDTELLEEYRQRHLVLMVDEFQDTNPLQHELVMLLCGEGQRLFIVGDPKQSIYLFRGADVEVFGQARNQIVANGGKSAYFQESFRSREGIITFVNAIFSQVMQGGSAPFEMDYAPGDHLEAQRRELDSTPCVELLRVEGGDGSEEKRDLEAAAIARKIRGIVAGEEQVEVFDRQLAREGAAPIFVPRPPGFGDIAILFRRFSNLKTFERELRRHGIPYYVVKGKGFYRCQEVLDILNLLRYLEFGGDLPALAGLLRSPVCGVSDETLYLLSRHELGIGAWREFTEREERSPGNDILWSRIVPEDRLRLAGLASLIARLLPLRDRLILPELLEEIITCTDFASTLLTTFQGEQKVANLRKLVELSRNFAGRGEGALRPFVNYLTGLVEAEPTEAEAVIAGEGEDVVRLMTVHQSKGLEFPVVFIPELGAQQPHYRGAVAFSPRYGLSVRVAQPGGGWQLTLAHSRIVELQRQQANAEQKRLFYVAVTRARDYLFLSGEGRGEWRQWLDSFQSGSDGALLKVGDGLSLLAPADTHAGVSLKAAGHAGELIPAQELATATQRALHFTPPLPTSMEFSPTALEDYAFCPRKYFYKAVMGLDEGVFAELLGRGIPEHRGLRDEPLLTPLSKGDLAHAMLERLDFAGGAGSGENICRSAALRQGLDPDGEDVKEVMAQVLSMAVSFAGEVAGCRLFREYPFLLRLRGEADYYIRGAMDLVAIGKEKATVYDYKYAVGATAELGGYRFQLHTYQVALAKGWPGLSLNGVLLFLRDGLRLELPCALPDFEGQLLQLMDAIRQRSVEADFGLREGCDGSHCPFRFRCGQKSD